MFMFMFEWQCVWLGRVGSVRYPRVGWGSKGPGDSSGSSGLFVGPRQKPILILNWGHRRRVGPTRTCAVNWSSRSALIYGPGPTPTPHPAQLTQTSKLPNLTSPTTATTATACILLNVESREVFQLSNKSANPRRRSSYYIVCPGHQYSLATVAGPEPCHFDRWTAAKRLDGHGHHGTNAKFGRKCLRYPNQPMSWMSFAAGRK